MNIITISREFGSGGRELGKRLADLLGYDYYDKEIIATIAKKQGLDANYVAQSLDNHGWQSVPLTFRSSFSLPVPSVQSSLLLEQKKIIEEIAKTGKDCVIVGRSAEVLLSDYAPFRIFVCADMEAKVRRCMERAAEDEKFTEKEMMQKIRAVDKNRARTRELIGEGRWGGGESYHLTVNTTGWEIKQLSVAVADFIRQWEGRGE